MADRERTGVHACSRILVYALLAAFLVCGFAGIEAWPLSGWRFFVHVRSPFVRTWTAAVSVSNGPARTVRFSSFSPALRDFVPVMDSFGTLDETRRRQICTAWARAALPPGETGVLRIYSDLWDVSDKMSTPADRTVRRALVMECGARGGRPSDANST